MLYSKGEVEESVKRQRHERRAQSNRVNQEEEGDQLERLE